MANVDTMSVAVTADTSDFTKAIKDADTLAQRFGNTMTSAFSSAVVRGKGLNDTINSIGLRLSSVALNAALKPLSEGLTSGFEGLFKGIGSLGSSLLSSTTASVGEPMNILPFASGGVVSTPSYFPMEEGTLGLMGEAGSEAIMPLSRGTDGRLGVALHGAGGASPVVVNIATPDAASFRRSQAEISATLARAVARGQKAL